MFKNLRHDIDAVMQRDPAARSKLEVLLAYPSIHALMFYRLAHWLWKHELYVLGRFVSHLGRMFTGIEIHPGAVIGRGVFIDHGMGVVIGETAVVGDNVTLYQGVTLGGTSLEKGKRHPTLENGVIVGAGAKVLGPILVGQNARIGSNAVVVKQVPADVSVVGIPGKVVQNVGQKTENADQDFCAYGLPTDDIPDPIARSLEGMFDMICSLKSRIEELESELAESEARLTAIKQKDSQAEDKPKKPRLSSQ
ncbi:MAG: serine O-acetyltransferase [Kordiimonas sp.]|nr:serine O-acetyltransferase [Kordiimonas sp.]|tara:strand:- start:2825 stop:3577 length:753 start_codon:yes stop_codon:yes gene_type:complete